MSSDRKKRVIIGISGATGAIFGVRLLQMLRSMPDWETHLVTSDAGVLTVRQEVGWSQARLREEADQTHNIKDIAAPIASGSYRCEAMIVAPCSMRSLSAIARSSSDNLLTRAADVILKERRKLVLMARETPLTAAHIENMAQVTNMGGIICPPVPAFYMLPTTIDELVNHTCIRVLDLLNVEQEYAGRWAGLNFNTKS
ncbi:UbiX family flavin prenyltransferase [Paraburkholderia sp. CNPSo 3076]|uniref:UbiX family flavin prenyltransferase n=1 Tax=Paraburkholderia sp. CNPSo 3076 TaxID=2940936 RepID=UPI002257528C|nr:UbiX family flavin prenyltransferase [Paraburkholderia sp. CNPSo 3076]MCX5542117.1 UbiX family flavin prenyltransferase [Paraburkholderia sp. CNPSo 3076]